MPARKTAKKTATKTRRTATKKTGAGKTGAKKTGAKKTAAKKTASKTIAQKKVKKVMHERKEGTLRSGKSGKKWSGPGRCRATTDSETARRARTNWTGSTPARASAAPPDAAHRGLRTPDRSPPRLRYGERRPACRYRCTDGFRPRCGKPALGPVASRSIRNRIEAMLVVAPCAVAKIHCRGRRIRRCWCRQRRPPLAG